MNGDILLNTDSNMSERVINEFSNGVSFASCYNIVISLVLLQH